MARVGPLKCPAHQLQREFLEDLVGGVFVAQGPQQIAADRPAVTLQQGFPGCLTRLAMRPPHEGPQANDAAQPAVPPPRPSSIFRGPQSGLSIIIETCGAGKFVKIRTERVTVNDSPVRDGEGRVIRVRARENNKTSSNERAG